MRFRKLLCTVGLGALFFYGCGGSAPGPRVETVPVTEPASPATDPAASPGQKVQVTAGALNVRRDPDATAEVVSQVKRGEILTLVSTTGEWSRVTLPDGSAGWVSSRHVTSNITTASAASPPRRRSGCPADADFRFVNPPKPSFTEGSTSHGLVVVDVSVSASGKVLSTKVVANSTGDPALADLAMKEIRSATFTAPIRNCVPRAFIYSYKRSF